MNPPRERPHCGRAIAVLIIWAALSLFGTNPAGAAEIWLNPMYRVRDENAKWTSQSDFMKMFQPDAPWQKAASHVKVLSISATVLKAASDAELQQVFSDIKRRGIVLGAEMGLLTGSHACGTSGTEGYSDPGSIKLIAQRVKRLGGAFAYVAMDEPLWFGRYAPSAQKCRGEIAQMAADVANQIHAIREVFPDAKVGDIEPIGNPDPPDWPAMIARWIDAYANAVGEPLAFVRVDVDWDADWKPPLHELVRMVRGRGVKYGIIYDGLGGDRSPTEWARHTEEQLSDVEADPASMPDQVVVQSWFPEPKRNLPEDESGTLTNMVLRYAAQEVQLTASVAGQNVVGMLRDKAGTPIKDAPVTLFAEDNGRVRIPYVEKYTGQVPAGARTVVIALRINTECLCRGPADVALWPAAYSDAGTRQSEIRHLTHNSSPNGSPPVSANTSGEVAHYVVTPGQQLMINTKPIAVTAGTPFALTIPMAASEDSSRSGYVALIFLDEHGKGIARRRIEFHPGQTKIRTISTDKDGRFMVPLPAEMQRRHAAYRVIFSGNAKYRLRDVRVE